MYSKAMGMLLVYCAIAAQVCLASAGHVASGHDTMTVNRMTQLRFSRTSETAEWTVTVQLRDKTLVDNATIGERQSAASPEVAAEPLVVPLTKGLTYSVVLRRADGYRVWYLVPTAIIDTKTIAISVDERTAWCDEERVDSYTQAFRTQSNACATVVARVFPIDELPLKIDTMRMCAEEPLSEQGIRSWTVNELKFYDDSVRTPVLHFLDVLRERLVVYANYRRTYPDGDAEELRKELRTRGCQPLLLRSAAFGSHDVYTLLATIPKRMIVEIVHGLRGPDRFFDTSFRIPPREYALIEELFGCDFACDLMPGKLLASESSDPCAVLEEVEAQIESGMQGWQCDETLRLMRTVCIERNSVGTTVSAFEGVDRFNKHMHLRLDKDSMYLVHLWSAPSYFSETMRSSITQMAHMLEDMRVPMLHVSISDANRFEAWKTTTPFGPGTNMFTTKTAAVQDLIDRFGIDGGSVFLLVGKDNKVAERIWQVHTLAGKALALKRKGGVVD